MDNFHSADCALRSNGEECTCGYIKPLTAKEEIDLLFDFMESNGDLNEISTEAQVAIKKWRKKYGKSKR